MRSQQVFFVLICAQALHSLEEYWFQLWESFPPARFLSGLVSNDLEFGFAMINVSVVLLGYACYFGPVRRKWAGAAAVGWGWVALELINGVGHPVWAATQRAYTPGLVTAVLLLPLAMWLATRLVREQRDAT